MVVRLGHNYYDKTPLIGKIVDINIWDRCLHDSFNFILIFTYFFSQKCHLLILTSFLRLLSPEEGIEYTNCLSYVPTSPGAFL